MPNRLANETSPYLLQHAENPVDWYPWGTEALERAQRDDRPIFLSIGYAACHWCHVMEHESFEDVRIAKVLNENFINIKVDREERPDLDQIYMNAVMALRGGGGGWPLSVFLTPTQEVFFGGTYWPPKARVGMPGFDQVLASVLDAFHTRRDQVDEQSQKVTQWLRSDEAALIATGEIPDSLLSAATDSLEKHFDFQNGGFGTAPKFPHPMDLQFLIRQAMRPDTDSKTAERWLGMVRLNLKKMAYGGIFDHLGGGFARYSVDEKWLVPHFEKMLYDNALLAETYVEMYRATQDPFYAMIARKTLDYLLAEMVDEFGGFHSTEDADSEGVEGKYYIWSKREVMEVLGSEVGARFCGLYGVTESGNFEGENILNLSQSYGDYAEELGITKSELRDQMRAARRELLAVRHQRVRPGRDDKVLVNWNALTVSALSRAAVSLGESRYLSAAQRAARFIQSELMGEDGRLLHAFRHGHAKQNAFLEDYAFLIVALVELYQADFDLRWLEWAVDLVTVLEQRFGDEDGYGFFFTSDDHEPLIARMKSFQDSSIPSGNAMAATGLIRLSRLLGRNDWLELAEGVIRGAVQLMEKSALASGQMLIALDMLQAPFFQYVLIAANPAQLEAALPVVRTMASQNSVVIAHIESEQTSVLGDVLSGKMAIDGRPTLYVCKEFQCNAPIVGLAAIQAQSE